MNRWQRPPKYFHKENIFNCKRYLGRISLYKNKIILSKCFIEMLGPVKSKKLDYLNILFTSINTKLQMVTCIGKPKIGGLMYVWTWDEKINNKIHNRLHIKIIA